MSSNAKLLHEAAEANSIVEIRRLVGGGAAIDALVDHVTPLICAANSDRVEAIEALVALGAVVNKAADDEIGWPPIFYAARQGHVGAVKKLLQLGGWFVCFFSHFWRQFSHSRNARSECKQSGRE